MSSSNNLQPSLKSEEDQLYNDLLNLSPTSNSNLDYMPSLASLKSSSQNDGNGLNNNNNNNQSDNTLSLGGYGQTIQNSQISQPNHSANIPTNGPLGQLPQFGFRSAALDMTDTYDSFSLNSRHETINIYLNDQQQINQPPTSYNYSDATNLYSTNENPSDISLNTHHLPSYNNINTNNSINTPTSNGDFLSPTNNKPDNNMSGNVNLGNSGIGNTLSPQQTTRSGSNHLNPNSPSAFSSHSIYSDNSQPASPYLDASSQFSNTNNLQPVLSQQAYSDVGDNNNPQMLNQSTQYLDADPSNVLNTFDTEIALGSSISNTNLVGLDSPSYPQVNPNIPGGDYGNYPINSQNINVDFNTHSLLSTPPPNQMQQQEQLSIQQGQQLQLQNLHLQQQYDNISTTATNNSNSANQFNLLTENNLSSYNQLQRSISSDQRDDYMPVISIHQAPEEVAAKTPSLFSNSSANSSIHNSPRVGDPNDNSNGTNLTRSTSNGGGIYSSTNSLIPNSQLVNPRSNQSNKYSSTSIKAEDTDNSLALLKPDEYQAMKRGRRKSHSSASKSRSGSRSVSRSSSVHVDGEEYDDEEEEDYDEEYDEENEKSAISTREKMLELASPNQSNKRTQKHPSVYACHLCEKKFTRPYNLKSHLRTHTDERPFICNVCGKAFARQHDRKRHEDLHTGEKKFQCKGFLKSGKPYGCGRKFARADALRRHFQTEAGKECIRQLIEEEEQEKLKNGGVLNPNHNSIDDIIANSSTGGEYMGSYGPGSSSTEHSIPSVAISPPE
ncbi:zf-C2H2 zinc finger, C2H2 type [Scheffersomyces xylosifermentans]|uniref:zf-C2H2 zinc finger, C2H2 type n=1 Tax=Scheffersomyces xylosifermentans TaxID=1304137 RepID=UPI00315C4D5C